MDDMADLDLGMNGNALPSKTDKIYLCDADTLLFGVCLNLEVIDEVLPRSFYSDSEWRDIVGNPYFKLDDMTIASLDIREARNLFYLRLNEHLEATGCTEYELHFTTGRKSFRYEIFEEYKANRTKDITKRPPAKLRELKEIICEDDDNAFVWNSVEADDVVCSVYDPEKHILGAVDKDVIKNLVGRHYNYYRSIHYNIEPKFVDIDEKTAAQQPYIQTLTGDTSDGVPGLKRVGPKTAEKLLGDETDPKKLWAIVKETYAKKGKSEEDALLTMRLVNMHQYSHDFMEVVLFGTVYITALNSHRLNQAKVGYLQRVLDHMDVANKILDHVPVKPDPAAKLIVINGVEGYEAIDDNLLKLMTQISSYYFINDSNYAKLKLDDIILVSQFKDAQNRFYSLSELHSLQDRRESLKFYDYVYWGHFKEERRERYDRYIPNEPTTLIVGNKEEWEETHPDCHYAEYTRDLDKLYDIIATGTRTTLIGDAMHDGKNVASRYFEAIQCGIEVDIDERLVDAFTVVDKNPTLDSMGRKLMEVLNG